MITIALAALMNLGRRIVSASLLVSVGYTSVSVLWPLLQCVKDPALRARLGTQAGMIELGTALIFCLLIGAGLGALAGLIGKNPTDTWIYADGFGFIGLLIGGAVGGIVGFYYPEVAAVLERPFMWQPDQDLRDIVGVCAGILIGGIVGGLGLAWIGEMFRLIRQPSNTGSNAESGPQHKVSEGIISVAGDTGHAENAE